MLLPFRLHEATDYPWRPSLTPFEFQKLLHNLTAIKIRGTYSERSKLVVIADDQTEWMSRNTFFAVAPTLQNSWNVCSVSSNVLLHGKTISFKQVFALIRKMDLD